MIFIFHGDNLPKSRETILRLQKRLKAKNKKEIDVLDITPNELKEMAVSFDIFSEAPFIVLDISDAGRKNLIEYAQIAHELPKKTTLIILSNKGLAKSNVFIKEVTKAGGKITLNNSIPTSNVFNFVDTLFSKKRAETYKQLSDLINDDEDPFYLFSMILYGLRNLAFAKFESPSFEKAAPFVKSKSVEQSEAFTKQKINKLYSQLYQTDKNLKTGKISPDLVIPYTIEKILR